MDEHDVVGVEVDDVCVEVEDCVPDVSEEVPVDDDVVVGVEFEADEPVLPCVVEQLDEGWLEAAAPLVVG